MFKTYPKSKDEGFTAQEIERGVHWLHTDVTCQHCGKEQPVAVTGFVGGPCVRCGMRTAGSEPEKQIPTTMRWFYSDAEYCAFCGWKPPADRFRFAGPVPHLCRVPGVPSEPEA